MNMITRLLNLAAAKASKSKLNDKRCFRLGAVGVRSDGAIVHACNGSDYNRNKSIHCEARLSKKLDLYSIVFVARVNRAGEWSLSRPCPDCIRSLQSRMVNKVYYTICPGEYGVINLKELR